MGRGPAQERNSNILARVVVEPKCLWDSDLPNIVVNDSNHCFRGIQEGCHTHFSNHQVENPGEAGEDHNGETRMIETEAYH